MRIAAAVAASFAVATTPGDLYKNTLLNAVAQQSVHYVSTSAISGNHERMVGNAARDHGSQQITFTKGGTTGHVTVVVANRTAYVRGDAFTLREYMGLPSAQAARYDGKWFFLKPPSGAYRAVAEAVTLTSFVSELAMPPPYTSVPHGVRSSDTRSGKTATITLYVSSGAKPLPVKQVASGPTGTISTTMGGWNRKVAITAPAGALAFH
jgi:hypothetical protein